MAKPEFNMADGSGFSCFVQRQGSNREYRCAPQLNSSDDSDSCDDMQKPKRIKVGSGTNGTDISVPLINSTVCSPKKKVKNFNIWGSVLQERSVSEGLARKIQVDKEGDSESDDNVESYNYKNKRFDTRPANTRNFELDSTAADARHALYVDEKETFGNDSQTRKRPHSSSRQRVKDRLGKRTCSPDRALPEIQVTAADSVEKIVNELVNVLNEPKVELMTRVVKFVGPEKTINLLHMTEDIEAAGGLLINDGTRRRTPGGVFLHLLRNDSEIESSKIAEIFRNEKDNFKALKRRRRKRILREKELAMSEAMDDVETAPREQDMEIKDKTEKKFEQNMDIKQINTEALTNKEDLEEGEISD